MTAEPCQHIPTRTLMAAAMEGKPRPRCTTCEGPALAAEADSQVAAAKAVGYAALAAAIADGRISKRQADSLEQYAKPELLEAAVNAAAGAPGSTFDPLAGKPDLEDFRGQVPRQAPAQSTGLPDFGRLNVGDAAMPLNSVALENSVRAKFGLDPIPTN